MKVFVVALALSVALSAAPTSAQAQAPAAPAPAPQTQKPAAPAPVAAQPAPAQPAVPTPRFQDGLKYAYIQVQVIAATSNEGKAFNAKVQALQEAKVKELQDKQKALQVSQEKLEKSGSVLNDAARGQLQADIERQQRDIQRASEDAQQEVTQLTQQLQMEFERRLTPIIDKVAKAKQVHFIFNAQDSGLVWADPSMDLTAEVIREFDAAGGAAAKPAPAPTTVKPVPPATPGK
jgi:Skp family chaperone for outer membrane proteins